MATHPSPPRPLNFPSERSCQVHVSFTFESPFYSVWRVMFKILSTSFLIFGFVSLKAHRRSCFTSSLYWIIWSWILMRDLVRNFDNIVCEVYWVELWGETWRELWGILCVMCIGSHQLVAGVRLRLIICVLTC